jgi:sensor c-di-GMP phosphodiesterase-like protein
LLRQLGCDKGQGYFYSAPLAATELVQWLINKSGRAPECDSTLASQPGPTAD